MDYFDTLNEEDKYIAETILENSLNEAPTTSGGSSFSDELIKPLIYYVQNSLTTKDLVDIQPINFKQGKVFGMDLLDDLGNVIQGTSAVSAFNDSFSKIPEDTIIPGLQLRLNESDVVIKTRKARLNYSQELNQDMKVLKFNLSDEKTKITGTEIANGTDFDIIKAIKEQSNYYTPITYDWNYTSTLNISSLLTELEMRILDASATVAAGTRKGMANFMIVPAALVKVIATMNNFEPIHQPTIGAVNKIGSLGTLEVYADTFDTTGYELIVGKKPEGNISSGVVFSPYKIEAGPEMTDPENFSLHQTVFNRYGITKVNGGNTMYCKVIVGTRTGFPFS